MNWQANWIKTIVDTGDVVPAFMVTFGTKGEVSEAKLYLTALGIYEAHLNQKRISDYVLAPGWTSYHARLQYQSYDVTDMLHPANGQENQLVVHIGKGWYHSRRFGAHLEDWPIGLLAQLEIVYTDGSKDVICSDESWKAAESRILYSEIYDGEIVDANITPVFDLATEIFQGPWSTLIPQEGEPIKEQEILSPADIFTTPNGETVIDFGQEITGYVEITVNAHKGQTIDLSVGEVLDKDGNFYNANYRSALCQYTYTCKEGIQTYHPRLTFYGFRYIRINSFPGGCNQAKPEHFKAIAVYSDMKRIGRLSCSDPLLNRLFENVVWGQKGNFLDVPTDCPQRDERLGWTGDAQVFVKTACLNFDTEAFFGKWLADLAADQFENGMVPKIIPDIFRGDTTSAAWGDAAVICPWTVYLAYGNPAILKSQFVSMKKWVDYITTDTSREYLWIGKEHYGDWLGLDAPQGSYKGSSREELIASAYYAYSTSLLIKAGKVLGEDMSAYETLYGKIVEAFRQEFPIYKTQTECAVAIVFGLAKDCVKTAEQLAQMVISSGTMIQTGFVGTPYLLHALSSYGYTDLAYSLLLRKEYPSWLYPVTKGATTIWEHWDGIMTNGEFWSTDMNSFNHYGYGAVADWIYCVAAGINTLEAYPGYAKVRIAPHPTDRLEWLKGTLETRHGLISSEWKKSDGYWRYEITTPVEAEIIIDGCRHEVTPGTYYFYSHVGKQV